MSDAPLPERSPTPDPREQSVLRLLSLLELAERGSRELDAAVALAVGWTRMWSEERAHGGWYWCNAKGESPTEQSHDWPPNFTTSLDAALPLVPEGWTVGGIGQNDRKQWHTELREGYQTSYGRVIIEPNRSEGTTAALSVCLAALKARP